MIKKEDSLGIPNYGMHYLDMPDGKNNIEDTLTEYLAIHSFINQVASSNTVPEYLFYNFKPHDKKVINASMVALLIKLYDEKSKKGLSGVRLDGGDFMLEKGFEDYDLNFENVLKRMKLIAARSLVHMELDEYINRIRKELSGEVMDKQQMKVIGKALRKSLTLDEIEDGIKLGINLREKHKEEAKIK